MARRAVVRRGFIRPPVRTKIWIGAGVGASAIAANSKVLISTLSAGALLLRPFTVIRTHVLLHWISDQVAQAESPFGAYGKLVVTDTAAALGITAVPDPSGINGDPGASWFVWQAMSADFAFASATGFGAVSGRQYQVDSKAMRKVGPDDDIVTLVTNQSATDGAVVVSHGRMLVQLH